MKRALIGLFFILEIFHFNMVFATSLSHGAYVENNTFIDGDYANGSVVINNTATLPTSGNVYINIFSGAIKNILADDSTITLSADLSITGTFHNLVSEKMLQILGDNFTLFLNQDQTLDNLKITGENVIIDAQGNTINLNNNKVLCVESGSDLHIKNCILHVACVDSIYMESELSKLILENCTLDLETSCSFNKGSLEIRDNVSITGDSLYTFSLLGGNHTIKSNSTLSIASGLSLNMSPTTSASNFFEFEDSTAQLILDGANLNVSAEIRTNINANNVEFKNNVTINSVSQAELQLQDGTMNIERDLNLSNMKLILK